MKMYICSWGIVLYPALFLAAFNFCIKEEHVLQISYVSMQRIAKIFLLFAHLKCATLVSIVLDTLLQARRCGRKLIQDAKGGGEFKVYFKRRCSVYILAALRCLIQERWGYKSREKIRWPGKT